MRRAFAAIVLSSLALVGAPGAAERADQIVGTWSYGAGAVTVHPAGAIFEGVVVRDIRFLECLHRAGERIWTIVRTPRGYAGRQFSFGAGIGCRNRIWVSANWRVADDSLRFWVASRSGQWPRECGSQTDCFTLVRGSNGSGTAGSPGLPVSFRFSLEGRPAAASGAPPDYVSTIAEGEGVAGLDAARGSAMAFHVQSRGDGELLELEVGGRPELAARGRRLALDVFVRSSAVAGCRPGARGALTLVVGAVDEVALALCGRSQRFRSGGDARVRVTFTR